MLTAFGFGFSLPAYSLRGGAGNNPFNQNGPTLDLAFVGTAGNLSGSETYTLSTNFIAPQYQIAAQYVVWETNVGLVDKTFSQIITFTRASTATYFDATGTLQSAAIDAPRFDYDPATLAARGFLIEEARTNLLTYSEQFDDAAWPKLNSSVTANATSAPDGTTTADKLVEDLDVNLVHQVSQTVTVVSLATYAASAFVKADTRTRVRIGFLVGGTSGVVADANLTAGTITAASVFGGATAVSSSIQALNNGWFRISVVGSGAAGTSGQLRLELLDASGNRQYNGDGTSGLFIWGAQLEAGAFSTSYIPTTTTALTRSADVASVNTLSPWFNAAEGTIFVSSIPSNVTASNFGNWALGNPTLAFGAANTIYNLYSSGVGGRATSNVITSGVAQGTLTPTYTQNANTLTKSATAYKLNDYAHSVNGVTPVTDTSATVPTVTSMSIGGLQSGWSGALNYLNGWIQRITYYPRRLPDAELQSITS